MLTYNPEELRLIVSWKGHPINTWCYDIYHGRAEADYRIDFGVNFWGPNGFDQATIAGIENMKKLFKKES